MILGRYMENGLTGCIGITPHLKVGFITSQTQSDVCIYDVWYSIEDCFILADNALGDSLPHTLVGYVDLQAVQTIMMQVRSLMDAPKQKEMF